MNCSSACNLQSLTITAAADNTVEERPFKGRVERAKEPWAFRPRVPFWNSPQLIVTSVTHNVPSSPHYHGMDPDRIFFVTSITTQRLQSSARETTARLLIDTLVHYREQQKYLLHEFVIMPDHIHALLTPTEEISLERAMQFIQSRILLQDERARLHLAAEFHESSHPRWEGLRAPSRLHLDESGTRAVSRKA